MTRSIVASVLFIVTATALAAAPSAPQRISAKIETGGKDSQIQLTVGQPAKMEWTGKDATTQYRLLIPRVEVSNGKPDVWAILLEREGSGTWKAIATGGSLESASRFYALEESSDIQVTALKVDAALISEQEYLKHCRSISKAFNAKPRAAIYASCCTAACSDGSGRGIRCCGGCCSDGVCGASCCP